MLRAPRPTAASIAVLLISIGASAIAPAAAVATPQAQLRVERGPYYVGDPIELHVQVTGFERSPEPVCNAEAPAGATLTLAALVPKVSSSVRIGDGQITRVETVTYTCQYVLVASGAGQLRLSPIEMRQGSVVATTRPQAITVQKIPFDDRMRIRVVPETRSVYVGQQVPVRIEWWLDPSLDQAIGSYAIRSVLFDDADTFRFVDDTVAKRGDNNLKIHTAAGEIALAAKVEQRTENGRNYLVIAAERRMVPLRSGTYELAPASVNADEVIRWQRNLFGSRRPMATRRLFARDEPLTLTVGAAPAAGRPGSFGGAIGRGFSLDVAADRSVVQLGDPITLTLTVRGEGQLTTVGLPPLDRGDALPPDRFRLSGDAPPGEITEGAKRFEVSVRVLDDAVSEIPEIEYAWFDPELGTYQTTRSRPIALSVRPAEVVSAADVVVGRPDWAAGIEAAATADAKSNAAGEASRQGSLSLIGADLSIERRIDRLLRVPGPALPAQVALYGGGLALLVGAVLWRRRDAASPDVARLRAAHHAQRARIDAAAELGPREALAEIAAALRELGAVAATSRSPAVDAFVCECDEILYAPTPVDDSDLHTRIERARALADAMLEAAR
ncbi:MAG: BatD family protein [Myxococcota bacterium]|jgi:hypothetical protein|nr:protein BatD [bacterium]MDP6075318.1 BatD family protein [Myxococcota bacterium]MDP6244065.1 BatD family protein [Myxococcota bacterium]MDP7074006.1 BatD family protein [Myxococcota bacterium]MDP7300268.1 BatD family protein [Myxococcota bacterium]